MEGTKDWKPGLGAPANMYYWKVGDEEEIEMAREKTRDCVATPMGYTRRREWLNWGGRWASDGGGCEAGDRAETQRHARQQLFGSRIKGYASRVAPPRPAKTWLIDCLIVLINLSMGDGRKEGRERRSPQEAKLWVGRMGGH